MFSKEIGAKAGATVSNKYEIQLEKKVFANAKIQKQPVGLLQTCQVGVLLKEGLQVPAQVFFCECCEIFKNTYFEKYLRTAASQNQHFRGKFTEGRIPEFYYPFKIFQDLNFAHVFVM